MAINKGLKLTRVKAAVRKCRGIVELFSRSWKRNRDLKEKQDQLGLPVHKLIGDVSTRWGPTYTMVSRIIEQQQAVCAVLVDDRKNWSKMLTDQELNTIEVVATILEPFSFLTDALSGEKNITLSAICPVLKHVLEKLTAPNDEDTRLAKEIKLAIHTDISNRYGDYAITMLLDKAAFLDPRFRECVTELEPTIHEIVEECLHIMESDSTESSVSNHLCQSSSQSSSQGSSMPQSIQVSDRTDHESNEVPISRKKIKGLAAVLQHIADGMPSLTNRRNSTSVTLTPYQRIDKEVKLYCEEPLMSTDTDPLTWWKLQQSRYPTLAVLAKCYLCICATSVPSERVFSSARYICNKV